MWKSADTTIARELLNDSWKPSVVIALLLLASLYFGTPTALALTVWPLLGGFLAIIFVLAWRRRRVLHVQLCLMLPLLPLWLTEDHLAIPDHPFAGSQQLLMCYLSFYAVFFLLRHQIIRFCRLEPAMEL